MVAHTCNLSCAGDYGRRIVTVRSAWATKKYFVFFFLEKVNSWGSREECLVAQCLSNMHEAWVCPQY